MVRPEDVGFRRDGLAGADRVISEAVQNRAFPGAVLAIGKDGALVHLQPHGRFSYEPDAPAVRRDTIYDLGSLTKGIVTTTMAMILLDEGRLDITRPVSSFLPGFRGGTKDRVTVEQLLTHSSGLPWWEPLFLDLKGRDAYVEHIQTMDLVYEPGTAAVYSDLGFILLGAILEGVADDSLDAFAKRRIFEPLAMHDTLFCPSPEMRPRIAPTENDPWRGRVLCGEVHDENAFAMGGVAGHSGLFGTAGDVARFAEMVQGGGVIEDRRIVTAGTIERFRRRAGVPGSTWALGWDTPSEIDSSAGRFFSRQSVVMLGFTGTSLWIDPERRLFLILLSNRVHPTRSNDAIRAVRPALADAVILALAR